MTHPKSEENDALLRAEDFLNAFNRIDNELRQRTGFDNTEGFKKVARRFYQVNRWWRDYEAMIAFADLRNVIVHERYDRFAYLSIPTEKTLKEIEAIRDRLLNPRTVYEVFRREVVTVDIDDTLTSVLQQVAAIDITQFPVYKAGQFSGLITSNGVMRWLSQHLNSGLTLVEFNDRKVAELLEREEARPNWQFIARSQLVDEVVFAFQKNPHLEAVLITQDGRKDQGLLGIATPWDIAKLGDDN